MREAILGVYKARREANSAQAHVWDPIDSDQDPVELLGSPRGVNDPIRAGDFPARPAMVRIAHTGLRPDWAHDNEGHHVRIEHANGRPHGRQATWTERVNIEAPAPINYGLMYELQDDDGAINPEDATIALRMGIA